MTCRLGSGYAVCWLLVLAATQGWRWATTYLLLLALGLLIRATFLSPDKEKVTSSC